MAEARLAVAFQFQLTDEGEFVIHIDRRIFIDIWRSAVRVVKRKVLKGRNAFMQVFIITFLKLIFTSWFHVR